MQSRSIRRNRYKCTTCHSSQIPSEVQDKAQQNFPSDVTSTELTVTQTSVDSLRYDSLFGYKFRFHTHLQESVPFMVSLSAVKGCSGDVDSWRLSCLRTRQEKQRVKLRLSVLFFSASYGKCNKCKEVKNFIYVHFAAIKGIILRTSA